MIADNVKNILKSLPAGIELVAATKDRTIDEIEQAIAAGITTIGENYIQEAQRKFSFLGKKVHWHFIGHLQTNKAKYAAGLFDMIETLDSLALAQALDKECKKINKLMPVLIEVNSATEEQKYGVWPDEVESFINELSAYPNLKPMGLMTMGPWLEDQTLLRPYFVRTKRLFDALKQTSAKHLDWRYLSMGMSASYKLAIEAGANIVRIGTAIFGPRVVKGD